MSFFQASIYPALRLFLCAVLLIIHAACSSGGGGPEEDPPVDVDTQPEDPLVSNPDDGNSAGPGASPGNGNVSESVRAACHRPKFEFENDIPFAAVDLFSFNQFPAFNDDAPLEQFSVVRLLTFHGFSFNALPLAIAFCNHSIYEENACSINFQGDSVITNVSLSDTQLSFTFSGTDGISSTSVVVSDPSHSSAVYTPIGAEIPGRFDVTRAADGTETFKYITFDGTSSTTIIESPDCSGTISSTSAGENLSATWSDARLPTLTITYEYCDSDNGVTQCYTGVL